MPERDLHTIATTMAPSLLSPQQFFARIGSSQLVGGGVGKGSEVWSRSRGLQIRCLNTFLPYPEFDRAVECLDNRRLGKQRVEAWQILRIVQASPVPVQGTAWANSPAVRMWRGFPDALAVYYNACLDEWARRGFKNVLLQPSEPQPLPVPLPPWLGEHLNPPDRLFLSPLKPQ
jgi:hypothetical protein